MTWHVKVTMDGVATCDEGGQILRFRPGSDQGPLVLISKAWPGVTVEDVTPPRTWTDGDVVQHTGTSEVWARGGRGWSASADRDVNDALATGEYRVLRYQAGE